VIIVARQLAWLRFVKSHFSDAHSAFRKRGQARCT
jgi:hypothetical protein